MKLLMILLSILSSFFANLEQKTLQSDFSVSLQDGQQVTENYAGSITMHGQYFTFLMGDNKAAFDGKTMYVYSPETEELTLTEPTEEELIESNPLLYAKAVADVCEVSEQPSKDGTQTIVTLVPADQSQGVNRFILKIRNSDLMPLQLEVKEGMKTTLLRMINPAFTQTVPEFTIEPEETTFVNDLRL